MPHPLTLCYLFCDTQVHKFGGTCVSAAERIASAAQLVLKGAEAGEQQVLISFELFFSAVADVVSHSSPVLHS